KHRQYLAMDSDYFRKWAKDVGPHALMVVSAILSAHKVEKQGYRTCTLLMKLADKYSLVRFEDACQRALSYTPSPSYKTVQTILKTGQDRVKVLSEQEKKPKTNAETHGFVRGADYYGGRDND
ncbi:MAG: IS21 family transposase, partial [Eubacteriales bacterium]|nr:IS21 family transposase [Eubacteriales bacterium]MDZ7610106.1 IS21 family transposase [Eubacteriales bacterium]